VAHNCARDEFTKKRRGKEKERKTLLLKRIIKEAVAVAWAVVVKI